MSARLNVRRGPVLGLCAFTHDASAALIVDHELVGFVEEERLSGIKHQGGYPELAVGWLLDEFGIKFDDVARVAYHVSPWRYLVGAASSLRFLGSPASTRFALPRARSFAKVGVAHLRRHRDLERRFPAAAVEGVLHHRAHAVYAHAASGFDDAAVLVVDSLGELQTTTIWGVSGPPECPRFQLRRALRDPASLGRAYGAVTEHLGWRRGDEEGTVMALAALGDPGRFAAVFRQAMPSRGGGGFALDPRLLPLRVISSRYPRTSRAFAAATCTPRRPGEPIDQVHKDVAAALQQRTEQLMLDLARAARAVTGMSRLCLAGGVSMNCLAAGRIIADGVFDEVFVPPAPADSGTAIGAAISVEYASTGQAPVGVAKQCYLGPGFSAIDLEAEPRPGLAAYQVADPVGQVVDALADGRIVGVFRGRLEGGPRALGHRSILASPLDPAVVERLNSQVKFREPFRPFAPVILAGHASEFTTLGQPSPYMSFAAPVTALARQRTPAIVHANGTARIQTVGDVDDPFLGAVLHEFLARTGSPVLINTSLNVKGKPICATPDQALDCLVESGLDALLLETWWVTK